MFRFFGVIGNSGRAVPTSTATVKITRFADGFVALDTRTRSHVEGNECFFVLGMPRLASQEHEPSVGMLYEEFRRDARSLLSRLRGRFLCALIRSDAGRMEIATDRFATWPVCYSTRRGFVFSDRAELVAGDSAEISSQAIFDYLYFHVIPAPETIFTHVRRALPAQYLDWSSHHFSIESHWMPVFTEDRTARLDEREQEFLAVVERAVGREASSAKPAAYLSGGTDSSTVAGMLTRVLGKPASTWSIGFDASGYDEMAYARIAARHFGTDHHEYYVTPDDLLEGIPRVAAHYDQPFGNSSAVPALICAERARDDGVDKLLAGDGGDELFAGNTRYAKQRVFGWYQVFPSAFRERVLEPLFLGTPIARIPLVRKASSYIAQARIPMPDRLETYNLLLRMGAERFFEPDFLSVVDEGSPSALQREIWRALETRSDINRMLAFDWKFTLADNDLPKVIGTTDLAGIEVGFPLLDDDLLDFSLSLPVHWKLRGLTLRWFFKRALRSFLPVEVIRKQKHGFGLPFGVWACNHEGLMTLTKDTLQSIAERGLIRTTFVDELLNRHLRAHPGYYGEMAWILMMLELWLRERAPSWRL